jgi:hypothetical protein
LQLLLHMLAMDVEHSVRSAAWLSSAASVKPASMFCCAKARARSCTPLKPSATGLAGIIVFTLSCALRAASKSWVQAARAWSILSIGFHLHADHPANGVPIGL